jgi:hypothetical protein
VSRPGRPLGFQGNPTDRNFIEGFHEELEPKDSSNETGRTPVFKYTPVLRSSEFSEWVGQPGYASEEERRHFQAGLPVKSSLAVPRMPPSAREQALQA